MKKKVFVIIIKRKNIKKSIFFFAKYTIPTKDNIGINGERSEKIFFRYV